MALLVQPLFPYASGSDTSRTLSYLVSGAHADYTTLTPGGGGDPTLDSNDFRASHDAEAEAAAWAYAPATHAGLAKRSVSSITQKSEKSDYIAFECQVSYGEFQVLGGTPKPHDTREFSWAISLESVHVDYAAEYIGVFGSPPAETIHANAIGVDADGNIEGAEVLIPRKRFRVDWTVDNVTIGYVVDNATKAQWENLVGKVNSDTYRHRAAGEVMFMGLTGSFTYDNGYIRNTFEFEVRENVTGLTVFGVAGCAKDGWERFVPCVQWETAAGGRSSKVKGIKVLRDYETATFTGVLP